jgi:iron complex outermembrane receptor protein
LILRLFICLIWIALVHSVSGQISLSGRVLNDHGAPLVAAGVYLHETMQGSYTDDSGRFEISNIRPGNYHLHVQLTGYHAFSCDLHLKKDTQLVLYLHEGIHQLHEVTVEAGMTKDQPSENPLHISLMGEEQLFRNPANNLAEGLKRLPGISSLQTGMGISRPVIRGMSGNRVLVAENGIKQEGQQWGADHGLEIDPFQLEQVEIIKGPASLAYGSDATAGVIHIRPSSSGKTGLHELKWRSAFQSVNQAWKHALRLNGNTGKWVYRFNMSRQRYGDYRVPAEEFIYNGYLLPLYEGRLQNTAGEIHAAQAMVGMNRNWGYSHLTASIYDQNEGLFRGATGIARAYQLQFDGDERNIGLPRQSVRHLKIISNSNIKLGRRWLETDLAWQKNIRKEFSIPHAHGRPFDFGDTTALELGLQTFSANARLYLKKQKKQFSLLGWQGGFQKNGQDGFEFLIPSYVNWNQALFYIGRKAYGHWTISYGGRIDYQKWQIQESQYEFYYRYDYLGVVRRNPDLERGFFNYSASIGAVRHFSKHEELRFNLARSFRSPNISELASNGVHHGTFRFERGNADLKAETGLQFDLGYHREGVRSHGSIQTYLNHFGNYIYLQPSGRFASLEFEGQLYPYPEPGQVFEYRQAPVLHYGGEAEWHFKWTSWLSWHSNAEYTWLTQTNNGAVLPFIPPASLKNHLEAQFHIRQMDSLKIRVEAGHLYYAPRNRMSINEPDVPEAHLFEGSLELLYEHKRSQWRLGISGNNLLNRLYYNNMSRYRWVNLPEAGRNVQIYLLWNPRWETPSQSKK